MKLQLWPICWWSYRIVISSWLRSTTERRETSRLMSTLIFALHKQLSSQHLFAITVFARGDSELCKCCNRTAHCVWRNHRQCVTRKEGKKKINHVMSRHKHEKEKWRESVGKADAAKQTDWVFFWEELQQLPAAHQLFPAAGAQVIRKIPQVTWCTVRLLPCRTLTLRNPRH